MSRRWRASWRRAGGHERPKTTASEDRSEGRARTRASGSRGMNRVAAIDCGTNSIRLLIADKVDGRLRDVHREMRIVRLGQGADSTGQFAPDALARTKAALVDYAELLRNFEVPEVRMVATSATRDAANRDVFFAMTADGLGAGGP